MPAPISDAHARAFAMALIRHGGNRRLAARDMGYPEGKNAKTRQMDMVRNPKVQRHLQGEIMSQLQALTPKALATLSALLSNKSAYVRLDAAKDVLNRNAVGIDRDKSNTPPLLISIKIGDRTLGDPVPEPPKTSDAVATTIDEHADLARALDLD